MSSVALFYYVHGSDATTLSLRSVQILSETTDDVPQISRRDLDTALTLPVYGIELVA